MKVIKSSLKLIISHADIFADLILKDSAKLYDLIVKLFDLKDREVKELASDCMQAVLTLVANYLAQNASDHRRIFDFFMEKF